VYSPYHERIGVWDSNGVFHTYFVEDVSSNRLLFNDNNLIVITDVLSSHISYIVLQPSVSLNLADLVVNLPLGQDLFSIFAINNHGDMIGSSSSQSTFLLERIDATVSQSFATPVIKNERHAVPPVIAAMQRRFQPQLHQLK
jgi:hypothetical protein